MKNEYCNLYKRHCSEYCSVTPVREECEHIRYAVEAPESWRKRRELANKPYNSALSKAKDHAMFMTVIAVVFFVIVIISGWLNYYQYNRNKVLEGDKERYYQTIEMLRTYIEKQDSAFVNQRRWEISKIKGVDAMQDEIEYQRNERIGESDNVDKLNFEPK